MASQPASQPRAVAVVASAGQPLSPAQRKFNQLVRQIEKLRADLQAWDVAETAFVQGWASEWVPLQRELADCRCAVVRQLDAMIRAKGWTRADRLTIRELLCHLATDLIEDDLTDEALAVELKALHDAHADVDFDTAAAEDAADMKSMVEALTGFDLGDGPVASEDELMQRMLENLQAQAQAEQAASAGPARKPTAAQRRREQDEKEASQSLREVFRKLASALHPDRADDEVDRLRRTEAMQRVNQAYERQDLLALFALQLEIEQIDAAHLATATADKARHYNRVLSEQVRELKGERLAREAALCMRYRLDPFEPLTPRKLNTLLVREQHLVQAMLHEARRDVKGLPDPAYAKRWLKARRAELKALDESDDFPFDLPF